MKMKMTYQEIMSGFRQLIAIYIIIQYIRVIATMGKINPDGTVVSDLTGDSRSTASTVSSSSSSRSSRSRRNWKNHRTNGIPSNVVAIDPFKGANDDLKGKVFIKGASQAAKYDEVYKSLIVYFGLKYDQRIHRVFEH